MLIHIIRDGIEDDVDDSLLVKSEGFTDNEHEYTTWVEYRFLGSDVIVHRSCHVALKKWPEGLGSFVQSLE